MNRIDRGTMSHWLGTALLAVCMSLAVGQPARASELEQIEMMSRFLEVMQGYYSLVNDLHEISSTPAGSMILQLQKLDEVCKDLGDRDRSIRAMREVFENTGDPVVRNAAAVLLADALKDTGRASQAAQVLETVLHDKM